MRLNRSLDICLGLVTRRRKGSCSRLVTRRRKGSCSCLVTRRRKNLCSRLVTRRRRLSFEALECCSEAYRQGLNSIRQTQTIFMTDY